MEELSFSVSSGLKDIIGRELITDDFIAVFELVKNAFDAQAKKVTLVFEEMYGPNPRITILDNGKGMSKLDLVNKWLFVAYSAKRDGSEDDVKGADYRSHLGVRRNYAGAKGIGRFSCDRLGKHLTLLTRQTPTKPYNQIVVDWTKFEQDLKDHFSNIVVEYKPTRRSEHEFNHGTSLQIGLLRERWDRNKLLRLKRSLERLINPAEQSGRQRFRIYLKVPEELEKDRVEQAAALKEGKVPGIVNGEVKNNIFDEIAPRTTEIRVKIDSTASTITTSLTDRGELIYSLTERSEFPLKEINVILYHLGQPAKAFFTRTMGIEPVNFGSVFVYKSGFRVYPYGEPGEDPLYLDKRKAQGQKRYIGTRELLGRIEINGSNEGLKETSSRVNGLIRTKEYQALIDFFMEKALKRLERYVVNVIRWGAEIVDPETGERRELKASDSPDAMLEVIAGVTRSKDILSVHFNPDFLGRLESVSSNSLTKVVSRLTQLADTTNDADLQKEVRLISSRVAEIKSAKEEAEAEAALGQEALQDARTQLEQQLGQNLFLRTVTTQDTKELLGLQHQILHSTTDITDGLRGLRDIVEEKKLREAIPFIDLIAFEVNKIATISRFATKANFSLSANQITKDLVEFIAEYVENVYKHYTHLRLNKMSPKISMIRGTATFIRKFRPLEIIIILDNLLSNSRKSGARNVDIHLEVKGEWLILCLKDNGRGITNENISRVFDFGFTTTNGSGIGLYHVRQLVEDLGGTVSVLSDEEGTVFTLTIHK